MKRWLWIIIAVCISTGVYYTIRFGLRPKPIPVMNPTDFTDLEQVGVVAYKRLRNEVRSERVVLIGSSTEVGDDTRLWTGFLKAALADKEKIVLFARTGLPALGVATDTVPFDDTSIASGLLFDQVRAQLRAGQLLVVHGLTKESSHLGDESLARALDTKLQHPVLSISTLRLLLDREQIASSPCADTGNFQDGPQRLDCATLRVSRQYLRKNLDPTKIWSVIERHGLKEYLVFIHTP